MLQEIKAEGLAVSDASPPAPRPSHWLIVIAKAQRECATCQRFGDLELQIDPYIPIVTRQRRAGRNRVRDVEEPMLRPYFFVPAVLSDEQFQAVRSTPGVMDFLWLNDRLAILPDSEIQRVAAEERRIEQLRRQRLGGCGDSRFMIGEEVDVTVGFVRMRAKVHTIDARGHVKVRLAGTTLFGRDVIEVDLDHILPAAE
jgi:transcription antitermination factor NusG